ncbi:glycosyltransferase family 4 protein [Hanstruepera ponticola]|uniref:glycosyltransferase family 4 protein n=1 Tax=Hanstruepera ponticola TaxID=2042995 RepID=UPI000CF1A7D5|nr:glycosyltransferase family 4 protein [Hanstruepera ponticola]
MKLAILANSYLFDKTSPVNGTFVQLHNLAVAFSEYGLDVHYICATKERSKPKYELSNGIHFYWIQKEQGLLEWKKLMLVYQEKLNALKPDAIYTRGRNVLQYVAGKYSNAHNIPYVWGTNGEDSAEFWKNIKRLKGKNKSLFYKVALLPFKFYEDIYINKGMLMPDYIVNQSVNQQETTKRYLKKDGIILPSYFLPIQNDTSKKNEILWLANLSPAKQPELFIKLIQKVDLKDWKAILAGGSVNKSYEKSIIDLASKFDISMPGKIEFENSFKYYQNAKIYINTSRPDADGLPNAYIQSWLSGAIVLSLHHDPNNWMQDYKIGFCAHGDLEALVTKIQELINNQNEIEVMSNNATQFAQEKFANQSIIKAYIDLFEHTH